MLYRTTTYPLATLIHEIGRGAIGLPELQRPFVWPNAKICDLFDSLYHCYPCGFLLLWETGAALKGIGTNGKEGDAEPRHRRWATAVDLAIRSDYRRRSDPRRLFA